jgi:hypothetical protein
VTERVSGLTALNRSARLGGRGYGGTVHEGENALKATAAKVEGDQLLAVKTYGWRTLLRVFILYANPVAVSFGAALHRQVVTTLASRGHEIDDCDLYAECELWRKLGDDGVMGSGVTGLVSSARTSRRSVTP